MKKLHLTFTNALNKTHRYTPNLSREDMTPQEVRQVMEEIVTLGIFEKNGVKQCTSVVSAKYVETIETPLFEVEK